MADLSVMYTSKSDEWATPQAFFDEINSEFNFNLDPCSTAENHKCNEYYTLEDDGLSKDWGGTESFAIHPILKLAIGLPRHFMKRARITPWSLY